MFCLLRHEPNEDEIRPDSRIGRFTLDRILGRGGFGTVWQAHDPHLDRSVAIKIPRWSALTAADGEAFLREARTAAQVRHPNVVSIHEVGRDDNQLYLVADLIDGETLNERILRSPPPIKTIVEWAVKLAQALHAVHEAGITHRDLKPANILLDKAGEPHLADFGLALRRENELTLTSEGQVLGTSSYLSPEIAQGESHKADARSDIFSFGIILYQLLTNELPFRGNHHASLRSIIEDDPPPPRSLNRLIPKDLETICMKCLEKAPSQRYQSARDLADDLQRFQNGNAIHARPIGPLKSTVRGMIRHPHQSLLAAVFVVLAVAGPLIALRQRQLTEDAIAATSLATENEATARANELMSRRHAYAADLGNAVRNMEERNPLLAKKLLERHIPTEEQPDVRGFEWRYLWKQCHAGLVKTVNVGRPVERFAMSNDGTVGGMWHFALGPEGSKSRISIWDLGAEKITYEREFGSVAGVFYDEEQQEFCFASQYGWIWRYDLQQSRSSELESNPYRTRCVIPMHGRDAVLAAGDYGHLRIIPQGATEPSRVVALPEKFDCQTLALSHDDRWCLAFGNLGSGRAGYTLLCINLESGKSKWTKRTNTPPIEGQSAAFLSGNEAIVHIGGQELEVLNVETGDVVHSFQKSSVEGTTWTGLSPDHTLLAALLESAGNATIWNTETRQIVAVVPHEQITWAQWLDDNVLVTSGRDGCLRWWDVSLAQAGARHQMVDLWMFNFWSAVSDESGERLLTVSGADRVEQWNLVRRKRSFRFPSLAKYNALYGPGEAIIASPLSSPNQLHLVKPNTDGHQLIYEQGKQYLGISTSAVSKCRTWLCVGVWPDGSAADFDPITASQAVGLTFVNLLNGKEVTTTTNGVPALRIEFSRDGRNLFLVNGNKELEVRKVPSGQLVWSMPDVFAESPTAMQVSPSESYLAVGGKAGTIQLTDLRTKQSSHRLHGSDCVHDIYFSPDEDTLIAACGGHDDAPEARGEIQFFDLESGQTILQLGKDLHTCVGFAFTPDELQMTTAHFDGRIHVWEGASDEEVEWQRTPKGIGQPESKQIPTSTNSE